MLENTTGNGLIVIAKDCIDQIAFCLKSASEVINGVLYVRIIPPPSFNEVNLVQEVYYQASRVCNSVDVRILLDGNVKKEYATIFEIGRTSKQDRGSDEKPYRAVVLGGTFDYLHNGHKVLLSAAILAASERIVCGITYGKQNRKKCLWELMQPLCVRMEGVKSFVEDVSHVRCEVHPIIDAFGPSTVDPNLEAIIVSQETIRGGQAVNNERLKKGLSELDVKTISLVKGTDEILREVKVSSSSLRRARLGTIMHPLQNEKFPKPFIIGLTGGIGSGKSHVAKVLHENGCEVIDCDKLVRELCNESRELRDSLTKAFGNNLLVNGAIESETLCRAVFANEENMKNIYSILWALLKARIESSIHKSQASYGVVKAPLLLEPRWDELKMVHQVWCCIVPPEEVVKRVTKSSSITKEEAERCMKLQMKNDDRVQKSDVVICTLWDYSETKRQVMKAFSSLKDLANSDKV